MLALSNALVNARLAVGAFGFRLFIALLARVPRQDAAFRQLAVPIADLFGTTRRLSQDDYQQLDQACTQLAECVVVLRPDGTLPQPVSATPSDEWNFEKFPLMAYVRRRSNKPQGHVYARFNDYLRPHLLGLTREFTLLSVAELQKLKKAHAIHLYWLLRQHAAFGSREVGVEELKRMLGLDKKYAQFPLFEKQVLKSVCRELAKTDMACTYDVLRQGKTPARLRFRLTAPSRHPAEAVAVPVAGAESGWEQELRATGLSASKANALVEQVGQGKLQAAYVTFVVRYLSQRQAAGKVRSLGGAVNAALTKGYFQAEYEAARHPPGPRRRPTTPALTRQQQQWQQELIDARRRLRYFERDYPGADAAVHRQRLIADIAQLEAQLASSSQSAVRV